MAMVYPKLSGEEITRRGKKHYENLRIQIETAENIGKIISCSVESAIVRSLI
ncbi:hypothetical protein [Nostoc sp.]|uniref:hypothetical protein n=1 Tax=Nostoc sp. TaxID=1180 RepID=UPI002FFBFB9D